ncbi:MAG: hypothetical protein Q9165_002812 [Trypethelium subeluteriae]
MSPPDCDSDDPACGGSMDAWESTSSLLTARLAISSVWNDFPDDQNPRTAFFNYTDLNTPIPDVIYNRQPQCADEQDVLEFNMLCTSTGPYAPILVIPPSILNSLDPAWSTCSLDIRGLNDPPYALQGFASPAAPTTSSVQWGSATSPPAPASTPVPGQPSKTASLLQPSSTKPHPPVGSPHGIPSQGDPPLPKLSGDPGKIPPDNPQRGDQPSDPFKSSLSHGTLPDGHSNGGFSNGDLPDGTASKGDPSKGDPSNGDFAIGDLSGDNPSSADPSSGYHVPESGAPQEPPHRGSNSGGRGSNDSPANPDPSLRQDGSRLDSGEHAESSLSAGGIDSDGGPASENSHPHVSSGQDGASGSEKSGPEDGSSDGSSAGLISDQDSGRESAAGEILSLLNPTSDTGTGGEIASMVHDQNDGHRVDAPHTSGSSQVDSDPTSNVPDEVEAVGSGSAQSPNSEAKDHNTHDHDLHAGTGSAEDVDQVQDDVPSIGHTPIFADPSRSSGIVVGTHHIAQGQNTKVDGTPISVGANGIAVGTSSLLAIQSYDRTPAVAAAIATLGHNLVYADPSSSSVVVIGGMQTLFPGQTTLVNGMSVSVGPQGVIIRGSTTLPLPPFATSAGSPGSAAIKIGSEILTAFQQSGQHAIVLGSSTLFVDGPPLTTAGEVISAATSGVVVISSGSTSIYMFSSAATQSGALPNSAVEVEAAFTIDGKKLTAYEVAGHSGEAVLLGSDGKPLTLVAGGSAATIDGQRVSLRSDGVVVGTCSSEAAWSTAIGVSLPPKVTSLVPSSELGAWSTTSGSIGTSGAGNAGVSGSASASSTKSVAAGIIYGKPGLFGMSICIHVAILIMVIG